jgi:hypothetical protein
VEYVDAEQLRFFFYLGGHTAATPLLRFDATTPYLLRLELGGMLPPATHPFWKHSSPAEIARRRAHLRLLVDGKEVSAGIGPQAEPVDAEPVFGLLPGNPIERFGFTGRILNPRVLRVPPP